MTRPILARINPAAFRHNYLLAKLRAPQSRAWCVVKANAYGHGILHCAEAVRDVADGFALLDMAEAQSLREAGYKQPILLLEGCFDAADYRLATELDLSVVLHTTQQLDLLDAAPQALNVFVKINTGMNRLGFTPADMPRVLQRLRGHEKVRRIVAMTHFAHADGLGVDEQWQTFSALVEGSGLPVSTANSAALLRYPQTHGDWVRPGIMLYGGSPMPDSLPAAQIGLEPVMTLSSRVIGVQTLQPGDQVGYSGVFTARYPMRVGIVACGYADGYPRHAPSGTPILVDGVRTQTVGRVSMDMIACDLTNLPDSGIGSNVVLWGEGLPADEVATAAGTVSYELFCALAARVPVVTS